MDNDSTDSLQYLPMERWVELEKAFLADWPRGIPAYNGLVTQRNLKEQGLDYGFKVYCPYGDINNGMVAFNKKGTLNEIIIQCPNYDTSVLEKCLMDTKIIDWKKRIMIPYMPDHIRQCVLRITKKLGLNVKDEDTEPNEVYLLNDKHPLFETTDTPDELAFKPIFKKEDINLVDVTWRNSYNGSLWFFETLAKANLGYGLYKDGILASWVFINEVGALTHLFTVEDHRKKGYGEHLMKHLCNICLMKKQNVFAYCRKGNMSACKLYEKLGFEKFHEVRWCFIDA